MPNIQIPKDRDVLADLALEILKKNPELARAHSVTVPKMFLAALRAGARRTARVLKKVDGLRKKADALSKSADADLKRIEKAAREIAQSIIRQAGTEAAKQWGFRFTDGAK